MPDPDYKALCAEMIFIWTRSTNPDDLFENMIPLVDRARAALEAQPEPQGPTDEELFKVYSRAVAADIDEQHRALQHINGGANAPDRNRAMVTGLRAVLSRWGRPAIEPVPVSERLPGSEDCDAEGRCWLHQPHPATPETPEWRLMPARYASTIYGTTHWLPRWALPVPGVEGADA